MRAIGSALLGATVMVLASGSSFGLNIDISHTAGCPEVFVSSSPISPVTNCNKSEDFSGNTLITTSLLKSWVGHTNFGASLNFGVEMNAPTGLSTANPSGVWGFMRHIVSEQITVSGASGDGILRVRIDVQGTTDVSNFIPGSSYSIGVSIDSTADGGVTGIGSSLVDIPFTYDSPFHVARLLDLRLVGPDLGGVGHFGPFGASADFLNGADFSFTVLDELLRPVDGRTVTSDDGFVYVQANGTAVAEPASAGLLAAGLLVLMAARRRRP